MLLGWMEGGVIAEGDTKRKGGAEGTEDLKSWKEENRARGGVSL